MLNFRLLLAALLFTTSALADCNVGSFEVSPKRPTSNDTIELRLAGGCTDGCVPIDERVTVDGRTIRVALGSPEGCILIPLQWARRMDLGRLPAGSYDVVVHYAGKEMARQTVVVAEAPAFDVLPRVGRAGTEVLLRGVPGCPGFDCDRKTVRFNDVPAVATRATLDGLVAVVPPLSLATDIVDVTVTDPNGTPLTAKGAFERVTRFDARDYVRVLFPLIFAGPGAEGSSWTSDNHVFNRGPIAVETIPAIAPGAAAIPSGADARVGTSDRDGGTLLLIPRGIESFFDFSSHIRDTSRAGQNNGTEMRVVFEHDTSSTPRILRIPADPRFRPRLRLYDIDGNETPVTISLFHAGRTILNAILQPRRSFVCITTPCEDAAFAALNLQTAFSTVPATDTVDVLILGTDERRLWAFVSVTNNETQQVTTYSPQR